MLSMNDHLSKLKSIKYFVPARTIDVANSILSKVNEAIDNTMSRHLYRGRETVILSNIQAILYGILQESQQ